MNFSIEKKGYSIAEVDAFVEDLIGKYQRLQAQNAELEQKLATAKRLIRRFSDTENALKQNIADSKRAAAYMISDAKDRSATLLDNARESCGEIISDLDLQIAQKMETVSLMKAEVTAFKEQLFSLYSSHIEMIDTLAQTAEEFEYAPDYTAVADAVDTFEEAGEPDCEVPEFVDYPEESIFSEIKEEEEVVGEEDFVLDGTEVKEVEDIVFETSAPSEESDEYSQLVLEETAAETIEEILFDIASEEKAEETVEAAAAEEFDFDFINDDLAGDAETADELEGDDEEIVEVTAEEFDAIDDDDYFKFLNDFINSDDGLN